ncbi:MAG: crosslink repair DNA glycosylase YcaQ family protein [Candidatus Zixiibacteriota bacterium]
MPGSNIKNPAISIPQARRLAINAQLLDGKSKVPAGKEGIARTIETIGYVQIDTISVVERAHRHTLWSRHQDFNGRVLHELQANDRRIFEYWGHAMSYLPMSDYRYYLPRMKKFCDPYSKWEKTRYEKYGHLMKPVLERIRKEGPLGSKDFAQISDKKSGTWWDWRPAKVALEMLFWCGELMITARHNFHRVYDLTERVLPDSIDKTFPDNEEVGRFFIRRALKSYGVAKEREIREHIRAADNEAIENSLNAMIESKEIIKVLVGKNNGDYYTLPESLEKLNNLKRTPKKIHILSPFDNLIIQRERTKKLFDFDYTIECYVPAAKRKYGYFVLPILWGDKFVGRMDAKAERKKKVLVIRRLHFEDGSKKHDSLLPALGKKLHEFARFNRCERIEAEGVIPSKMETAIKNSLQY